ncbi:hypothetical protein CZ787_11110 [Halomonas citrativorans]|uniref:Uncharacterized protein n=1 Tax=Halomonas citrativorans TaxID=2742612 RepID=A0A1R4I1F9_9GAMM|nr:hypothetical protein [Halomonas citrativorans]SJN13640.1 hypothetical protein CZ787_11110 [Halomonas citrativorans]
MRNIASVNQIQAGSAANATQTNGRLREIGSHMAIRYILSLETNTN